MGEKGVEEGGVWDGGVGDERGEVGVDGGREVVEGVVGGMEEVVDDGGEGRGRGVGVEW